MKPWKAAALAGALLWGACSKEPAPAPAPAPTSAAEPAAEPSAEPAAEPEAEPQEEEAKPEEPQAAAPEEQSEDPPEFKVGQTREQVMKLFGDCAERRAFRPASSDSLYVEIYQPKKTDACLKRLGERRFTIRGDVLYEINPGLYPPEPKPRPRPRNRNL